MRTLYLATPLQVPHRFLKGDGPFAGTCLNRGEIFRLLFEVFVDGISDQLRDGPLHGRGLLLEGKVELGLQIDGGSLVRNSHEVRVAIQPGRVKRPGESGVVREIELAPAASVTASLAALSQNVGQVLDRDPPKFQVAVHVHGILLEMPQAAFPRLPEGPLKLRGPVVTPAFEPCEKGLTAGWLQPIEIRHNPDESSRQAFEIEGTGRLRPDGSGGEAGGSQELPIFGHTRYSTTL